MEEIPGSGSTEVFSGRGQAACHPPSACSGASEGQHLAGVKVVVIVGAAGDQEYLERGTVIEEGDLSSLTWESPTLYQPQAWLDLFVRSGGSSLEVTFSRSSSPLYSVTTLPHQSPPVRMMVLELVWIEQWWILSCLRVKPTLPFPWVLSRGPGPPSHRSSSVVVGVSMPLPPTRRRPCLVTAELWNVLPRRVLLQYLQPFGTSNLVQYTW